MDFDYKLFSDGSSNLQEQIASIAFVVLKADLENEDILIHEYGRTFHEGHNSQVTEALALFMASEWANENLRNKKAVFYSDRLDLIDALKGKLFPKQKKIQRIVKGIHENLAVLDKHAFRFVRRNQNKLADNLSKRMLIKSRYGFFILRNTY